MDEICIYIERERIDKAKHRESRRREQEGRQTGKETDKQEYIIERRGKTKHRAKS